MSFGGKLINSKEVKVFNERFEHLYGEKLYHISKRDNQSLCTGYRPNEKGVFEFCIRLQDHHNDHVLTLTLFQFVRLMKDVREVIFSEEEIDNLDETDANLQFKFSEVNIPMVLVEVDSSLPVPSYFHLKLRNNSSDPYSTIILTRKTLRKIGELEGELIGTIETLENSNCNFMFQTFLSKCVDHIQSTKTSHDSISMRNEIKLLRKTPYQCEIIIKYWSLLSSLILKKIRGTRESSV